MMLEPISVGTVIRFQVIDKATGRRYPVEWYPFEEHVKKAYERALRNAN